MCQIQRRARMRVRCLVCGGVGNGDVQVALPLASNFPPVDLFTRLLQTHNRYAVIASAQRVCFALLEGILRAKEQVRWTSTSCVGNMCL